MSYLSTTLDAMGQQPVRLCLCYIYRCWMILVLAFAKSIVLSSGKSKYTAANLPGSSDYRSMWRGCVLYGGGRRSTYTKWRSFVHLNDLVWWYFRYWNSLFTKQWLPFLHNGFCQFAISRLSSYQEIGTYLFDSHGFANLTLSIRDGKTYMFQVKAIQNSKVLSSTFEILITLVYQSIPKRSAMLVRRYHWIVLHWSEWRGLFYWELVKLGPRWRGLTLLLTSSNGLTFNEFLTMNY